MTPGLFQFLQVASVIAAFVSAMLLYYGSLGVHREMQGPKGHVDTEKEQESATTRIVSIDRRAS
jgi:high-affinity Fe2+/Pb2+ permease